MRIQDEKIKTKLLIIVIAIAVFISHLIWVDQDFAGCATPLFGASEPCFDYYGITSSQPFTEKSIMESVARNIEVNHYDWEMSDEEI